MRVETIIIACSKKSANSQLMVGESLKITISVGDYLRAIFIIIMSKKTSF